MLKSIRFRLAAVYAAVLALVLAIFGLALYAATAQQLGRAIDASVSETAQHVAASVLAGGDLSSGHPDLPALDPFSTPGIHVQILDLNGVALAHSEGLGLTALPREHESVTRALAGEAIYYTATAGVERIRVYNLPLREGERVLGAVQVGKSYHDYDATMARLEQLLLAGSAGAVLLAAALGWAVAGGALRPISDITTTARAIAVSRAFSRRLPDQKLTDEVGRLALSFNGMLESLEAAYTAQKRFVADASHELRAPLTTIRGNLEFVERAKDLPLEQREEAIGDALAEARRMGRLVDDLLSLARADAGQATDMRPVVLDELARGLYQELQPRAPDGRLHLGRLDQVTVWGDPDRLKQVLLVLVDNALKYTPAEGKVEVTLVRGQNRAELRVTDTGIGIDATDLPHIFERFYRADKARARDEGGTGLGLAIAQAIVDEHLGTITVDSTPDRDTTFTVFLPLWVTPNS